jgi:2-hydroxychromene-2-carboxylate isomerase
MPRTLEFFFDYGSPYSYLASTQVEGVCARTHATLTWRPVLLGAIFKATGNVPPASNMHKAQYLLKDLKDWAHHYGLPEFVLPDNFPNNSLKADRVGIVVQALGPIAAFTHAVYRAGFQRGQDLGVPGVLEGALREAGMDAAAALGRAESDEIKAQLRANTEEALSRGAFGVPTFFVGDDMYVGNDRLAFVEAALAR